MQDSWQQCFTNCQLRDQRLTRRAGTIGKALHSGFGKALSQIFPTASALKRAYEFLPIPKQNLPG